MSTEFNGGKVADMLCATTGCAPPKRRKPPATKNDRGDDNVRTDAHGCIATALSRVAAAAAFLLAALPAGANNVSGAWSPVKPWPLIAVHAVLMPDGRVLTYGSTATGQQTAIFIYDVWDSAAGLDAGHTTLPNTTGTDIFCSSQVMLPSGEPGLHRRRRQLDRHRDDEHRQQQQQPVQPRQQLR